MDHATCVQFVEIEQLGSIMEVRIMIICGKWFVLMKFNNFQHPAVMDARDFLGEVFAKITHILAGTIDPPY